MGNSRQALRQYLPCFSAPMLGFGSPEERNSSQHLSKRTHHAELACGPHGLTALVRCDVLNRSGFYSEMFRRSKMVACAAYWPKHPGKFGEYISVCFIPESRAVARWIGGGTNHQRQPATPHQLTPPSILHAN